MNNRDLLQRNPYKPIESINLDFVGKWLILVKPEGEVLGAAFIPNGEGAEILPLGEFRKDFVDLMLSDFQCAIASNSITAQQLDWIKWMHCDGRFLTSFAEFPIRLCGGVVHLMKFLEVDVNDPPLIGVLI